MKKIDKILANDKYRYYVNYIKNAEKDRKFCRHGIEHSLDVARIAYIINLEEEKFIDKEIIYATALLHDIGRAKEYKDGSSHHLAGADIAEDILADAGFSTEDRKRICLAIASHKQCSKEDELLKLLYRADKLSRCCFDCDAFDECYWDDGMKNKTLLY